uniref:Ribosomal RNA methyltransferase FtsJ domain-containing protein n=1 Tax=viral metagenome TaxID=1070528 RepID=A0A6C0ETD7_9ZZZZ
MNSYNINEIITIINKEDIIFNKDINYINNTLKLYIHSIKEEIDPYIELWEKNKKYLNPYEFINTNYDSQTSCVCSYKPISRAFFKMIEILHNFNFNFGKTIHSFHLAEGPGGFIEAISYFRKNKSDLYYGITLMDEEQSVPKWSKSDFFLSKNPNIIIEKGIDQTGNLYNVENLIYMNEKYKNSMDFITGDGGFDFSIDFNKQEENSLKLIFCEICFAMVLQKKGGSFVLKVFDLFTSCSVQMIYLLNYLYEEVIITKPLSSRPANSEKYIVCLNFKMVHNLNDLINIFIKNYNNYDINNILNINMSNHFLEKIKEINSIFGQSQIENILGILNYIVDTCRSDKIEQIKKTHLSKCSKWCKKYNLPIYDYYN